MGGEGRSPWHHTFLGVNLAPLGRGGGRPEGGETRKERGGVGRGGEEKRGELMNIHFSK